MIKSILGIIILLAPFLLIEKFKDKKTGFFAILTMGILAHLFIAIITQAMGLFRYNIILTINLLATTFILYNVNYENLKATFKETKLDFMLIPIIGILSIIYYSVHYNYSGLVSRINNVKVPITNLSYHFPYFSDEWITIKWISYIIETGNLPVVNPFWHNTPFANFVFPFNSFLSEIFLILNLNPVTNYVKVSIFTSILICILVYSILRINNIKKLPSAIACLAIPYIVNGANLPGTWVLLPITLGLITYLLSLIFIIKNNRKLLLVSSFLTLLFYPPLLIFLFASILVDIFLRRNEKKKSLKKIISLIAVSLIASLILIIQIAFFTKMDMAKTANRILSKLIYPSLPPVIMNFPIWFIIPPIILIVCLFSLNKETLKKGWLIAPIITGLVFLIVYSSTIMRFIISYERAMFTTAVLITLLAGFGISNACKLLEKNKLIKKYNLTKWAMIIILLIIFIISFSYTQRTNWQKLEIEVNENRVYIPAAPANQYLTEEDLEIFSDIENKNFTTPPWKGLTIGATTNNYPLEIKDSTIYFKILDHNMFMNLNCQDKKRDAIKHNVNYVYSRKILCDNFIYQNKSSSEGLYLYKFEY